MSTKLSDDEMNIAWHKLLTEELQVSSLSAVAVVWVRQSVEAWVLAAPSMPASQTASKLCPIVSIAFVRYSVSNKQAIIRSHIPSRITSHHIISHHTCKLNLAAGLVSLKAADDSARQGDVHLNNY